MSIDITRAAVAIFCREDGQVLLAQRPEGKSWAGWWEFPGGKIEAGETVFEALKREVQEELGCEVVQAGHWLKRTFSYPERTVELNFCRVFKWQGEPSGCEGQALSWQHPQAINVSPVLPANALIMQALCLPPVYAITNLAEMGEDAFLLALAAQLQAGLKLIQIREKHLSRIDLINFVHKVQNLVTPYQAKILLNAEMSLAQALKLDGVHLTSEQLMRLQEKPANLICAASCHNAAELAHASQLGLDFAVLSPVQLTQSHAEAKILGWQNFSELAQTSAIPVYALGGMVRHDLDIATLAGGHGIAMQRAIWER